MVFRLVSGMFPALPRLASPSADGYRHDALTAARSGAPWPVHWPLGVPWRCGQWPVLASGRSVALWPMPGRGRFFGGAVAGAPDSGRSFWGTVAGAPAGSRTFWGIVAGAPSGRRGRSGA